MTWSKRWLLAGAVGWLAAIGSGEVTQAASPAPAALEHVSDLLQQRFTKTVDFTNDSAKPALDVTAQVMVLPPRGVDAQLKVLSSSPPWTALRRDASGNWVATYEWPQILPGQVEHVTLQYAVQTEKVSWHLPPALPPYVATSAIYQRYTSASLEQSQGVNTDAPAIADLVHQLTAGMTSPVAKAKALFNWVVTHIQYNYSLSPSGGALATLASGKGICSDIADLYVAMLRTAHIPARVVEGYVTNNGAGVGGFHQWVEFYLPQVGWVPADPTWGGWGYFAGLNDNWHIPLFVGLGADAQASWRYALSTPGAAHVAIGLHYHFQSPQAKPATVPVPPPFFPQAKVASSAATPWWSRLLAAVGSLWQVVVAAVLQTFSWYSASPPAAH